MFDDRCFSSIECIAGETGNDVEHLASTSVSVLVGERGLVINAELGDAERGEELTVPFSNAGKIFVSVLVTVRCVVDGDGFRFFFNNEAISRDGVTMDEGPVEADDDDAVACNI